MCLFKHNDKFLFSRHHNLQTDEDFFRPLGGGMEFQELSVETIRREIKEELGAEIRDLVFVDVLENIFDYKGETLHQIIFIYKANFQDIMLYDTNPIYFQEDDLAEYQAEWLSLAYIQNHNFRLVPQGIEKAIQKAYQD